MSQPVFKEARSLEEAFFFKRDAELVAELRRREAAQTRKKALAEVSGIEDEKVLDELVAHEIHAETLAAFSLVPVIEVAWADGVVQSSERAVILRAVEEAGIHKETIAYQLVDGWLIRRPKPKLMELWRNYTRVLVRELNPGARAGIKRTVLRHARAVAGTAGGVVGLGRVSSAEEKVLNALEEAFKIQHA